MSLFRLIFFFYYGHGTDFTGLGADIVRAFYMGTRFDAVIAAIVSAPVTLVFAVILIIGNLSYLKKLFSCAAVYYTAAFGTLLVLLCVDFGFYSYFQNHFNIMVYGIIEDDTKAILTTIYKNYNIFAIAAGFALIFAAVYFISKSVLKVPASAALKPKNIFARIFIVCVLIFANAVTARGSLGTYPIGVNASVSSNAFINKTAINCFFTFLAAVKEHGSEEKTDYIEAAGYKDDIRRAFADYLDEDINNIPSDDPQDSLTVNIALDAEIEALKPNVILIVMESLGSDLIKYNSSDFDVLGELQKHFDSDTVFYNFVPAYHSTDGSIESVISNVARKPSGLKLSQSKYAYNKYKHSGPVPYKAKGYETVFIYGGNTAWRNIGNYMSNLGFDKVYGEKGMNMGYSGNEWGIYDEFLFDYIFKTMESNEKRKFIYSVSTTNHPPYSLPDNYIAKPLNPPQSLQNKIIGGDLAQKRFKTYQYANEMLGRFITKIKNSKYADNTIIAVTGDHNFKNAYSYSSEELLSQTGVPFYLYIPEKIKKRDIDVSVFGSYLDIMPTLYNLSLSDVSYTAMGTDLLSQKAKKNRVYTTSNDMAADNQCAVIYKFQDEAASKYYLWEKDGSAIEISSQEEGHKKLIKYVLALSAVSDYMIKYTAENANLL
jgi:phosphoglycerol transferase MdoB-like AlkP superfamily enzyme